MEPEKFGRRLGIGMRVASNILRERAGRAAQANAEPTSRAAPTPKAQPRSATAQNQGIRGQGIQGWRVQTQAASQARAASRGARKFGQAIWGPLYHAGSVLWLEVTGLFFALFAVFFAQNIYRVRTAWKQGAQHGHFLLYIALTAVFVWFSTSSFLRAHRKGKRRQ